MSAGRLPAEISPASRLLAAAEFHRLAEVPSEVEWFANLSDTSIRRAYENAVGHSMRLAGIRHPEEFRIVSRAHLIGWREDRTRRNLGGSTILHRLSSIASWFEYLCEKNAVTHNPVKGFGRPQADTIKCKHDRAILSTLLFHALRRDELCKLNVKDFQHARKGVPHGQATPTSLFQQAPGHPQTTGAGHCVFSGLLIP